MDQNFALVQRPAAYSWEALTTLLATDQETAPIEIQFPRPVIVLSAYPSICVVGGDDSLPVPTLDDLLVKIEIDRGQESRLTSRFDTVQSNGVGTMPNVTLGSYKDTTGGARVMNYDLGSKGSRPLMTVTYSWKRLISGGPYYQDIQVGLVFHCNFGE
jgi:hypothetical protein